MCEKDIVLSLFNNSLVIRIIPSKSEIVVKVFEPKITETFGIGDLFIVSNITI